jgi:hypothetical protein
MGGIAADMAASDDFFAFEFYLVRFCRRQDLSYQNIAGPSRCRGPRPSLKKAIALTRWAPRVTLFRWAKNLACA